MMLPISRDSKGNLVYEGGVEPIAIRTSERESFKKCRRLWSYTSQNQKNLEPVRLNKNLAFGIAVHVGLEHYYMPGRWHMDDRSKGEIAIIEFVNEVKRQRVQEAKDFGTLSPEREAEYDERVELGVGMLQGYAKWAPERDREIGLTPLAVEYKFQVPLMRDGEPVMKAGVPVVYQLRVDMLGRHNDGIWIWDHKTAGTLQEDTAYLDLDTQLSSYAWAYQSAFGQPVQGILYNELEKTVPHPPKVLKNGSLSQDKRQLTTYELYSEKIEELGLDPAPYSDMLDYLSTNKREYFLRSPVARTTRELLIQAEYVHAETADMLNNPSLYPSPNKFGCRGCDFRYPCGIATEGGDVEFALSDPSLYRQRRSEESDSGKV